MTIIAQTVVERLVIDPGWYPAKIKSVEQVTSDYGPQLEWKFDIDRGTGQPCEMRTWSGCKFAPGTKLFAWVEAIFNIEIQPDQSLDTAELVGAPVDVRVIKKEGTDFYRISELKTFESMTKRPVKPTPAALKRA